MPFSIRAGKKVPITCTEVVVQFKEPPHTVFVEYGSAHPNCIRLNPEVLISINARAKLPGEGMRGENVELVARSHPAHEIAPYERLLGDALHGDPSLFVYEDAIEAAWSVVDPILDGTTPSTNTPLVSGDQARQTR